MSITPAAGLTRGGGGQSCRSFPLARDMAEANACARYNPLIRGINPLGEIIIGDTLFRERGARTQND